MNKTAIKKFAIEAREMLLKAVKQQAYEYEITADGENIKSLSAINGHLLTNEQKEQRRALVERIEAKGYENVMEEAAYTWFNRFIALRYMEVNGFLPSRVRVFTDEDGKFKPEIMKEAMTVEIDGLDRNKVFDLLEKQNNEELYKYLLITQCNALGEGLPKMFEQISDWTELLFPPKLLRDDSVIGKMVNEIPEEDFTDAVQIIGWMYQYYNTELKEEIDRVQGIKKINKTQIPAATQIFTPDWIVRYMVENSLGRIYISDQLSVIGGQSESERIEAEKAIAEQMGWKYYLPEAEQTPEVRAELNKLITDHSALTTLKVIDPCMGSGHILVYAFDVLMQIYTASGWSERDAAKSIVENNLYGLDIDDRAGQLAYFAVMMKARKYNRRALAGGAAGIIPNVYAIQESNHISTMAIDDFCNRDEKVKAEMGKLIYQMRDAKEYGSILNITGIDFDLLFARCDETFDEVHFHQNEINEDIIPLIKIAHIMAQKYDVVVTNPPYMGARLLNDKLRQFMADYYTDAKTDTYATFVLRCLAFKNDRGYVGMMTPNTWLTINSYKKLRDIVVSENLISSMILLSSDAFNDAGVVLNSFVLHSNENKACFCNLQIYDEEVLSKSFDKVSKNNISYRNVRVFLKLPNTVIDPSFSDKMISVISNNKNVHCVMKSDGQTKTGDNDKYLRMIWEVDNNKVGADGQRWCLHAKGGSYRKWYGNVDNLIDWSPQAISFYRKDRVARITPEYLWYKEGITWSLISGQHNSFRILPKSHTFNCAAPTVFFDSTREEFFVLGLLNTSFAQNLLKKFNATLNLTIDDVGSIPYTSNSKFENEVVNKVDECISISKKDWDSFETSWDFKKHPLI